MTHKKIKIVTDSVADLPADLLEQWDITVIPCYVNYDGESYADDGVELDRAAFYNQIPSMQDFPTTAAPSPGLAQEMLAEALEGHDHLISINVPATLSTTINNVRLAAQEVDPERITVIDSQNLSMGIGFPALIAAEVAAETGDVDAVISAIERVRANTRLYCAIYTMDFLRRSGRVNAVVASIGSILQIKPILLVEDSRVESVHRIRTFKRARQKLRELLIAEGDLERLAIVHTQSEDGAKQFREDNKDLLPQNTFITEVGPTLGTHIGLNSIGFVSVKAGWQR